MESIRRQTRRCYTSIKLFILLLFVCLISSQSSILSISSFKSCVAQDFSARGANETEGQEGQFLNCTGDDTKVTILNLRLNPASANTTDTFQFNLTVVPAEGASQIQENTIPNSCQADVDGRNCQLTTPATFKITRSDAIVYYQLRRVYDLTAYYCHLFHQETFTPSFSTCVGCVNPTKTASCSGWPKWNTCNVAQPNDENIQGCQFFKKFQNIREVAEGCPPGSLCGEGCEDAPDARCTANRARYWSADSEIGKKNSPQGKLTKFGFDSLRFDNTGAIDFSVPLPDPFPGPPIFSQTDNWGPYVQPFQCYGSSCQAASNNIMYNLDPDFSEPLARPPVRVAGRSVTNYIEQLEPLCIPYLVDATPKISVTVDIEVEVDGEVETFTLNNISPNVRQSSQSKYLSGRIISVDTSDGYLGPFVSGVIMICGGNKTLSSGTQQVQVNNSVSFNYTDNGFWDMRQASAPGTPSQFNVWDEIRKNLPSDIDRYYPINQQLNTKQPNASSVMWYYISPARLSSINRNCGGLGFTDQFWSTSGPNAAPNRQSAQQACLQPPDRCMPGRFSGPVFDPDFDNAIPGCLAAEAFTILSNRTMRNLLTPDRLQLAERIADLSMPPGANNRNKYDSSNPQWFIADSNRLYYDYGNLQDLSDLSFEVVLDVTGTFVRYTTTVSNGEFIIEEVPCNVTQGRVDGSFRYRVRNTGSLPAGYLVTYDCDPDLGIENLPASTFIPTLQPGNTSELQDVTFAQSGAVVGARDRLCTLNLLPSGAVNVYLQNQTVTCFVSLPPSPTFAFNDTPLEPSNITRLPQCDCFDFQCFDSYWDSGCFLGIFIFLIVLAVLFVGGLIAVIAGQIKYADVKKKVRQNIKNITEDTHTNRQYEYK